MPRAHPPVETDRRGADGEGDRAGRWGRSGRAGRVGPPPRPRRRPPRPRSPFAVARSRGTSSESSAPSSVYLIIRGGYVQPISKVLGTRQGLVLLGPPRSWPLSLPPGSIGPCPTQLFVKVPDRTPFPAGPTCSSRAWPSTIERSRHTNGASCRRSPSWTAGRPGGSTEPPPWWRGWSNGAPSRQRRRGNG